MNMLFAAAAVLASALDAPADMQPRVLMGDFAHCDAIMVRNGHISIEKVCVKSADKPGPGLHPARVAWDSHEAVITEADEKASVAWIRSHSLLSRLSKRHHDLYWDGKRIELGKVDVLELYEAIPWQGGVLVYGRTIPRRHFWESWPFKGPFIDVRDMEPFCAIYFDLNTLRGEDYWINGKAYRGLFVFPIPN